MATIALAAAVGSGAIEIGAATQIVLTVAATYVDSLIMGKIFAPDPQEGTKVGDLDIGGVRQGTPTWRVYGDRVRVPGTVIWQTRLSETRHRDRGGGKGGSGGTYISYTYSVSAALEFAVRDLNKPIGSIERIYADGKPIFDEQDNVDFTETTVAATVETISSRLGVLGAYLVLVSSGYDLTRLKARLVAVTGFSTTAHDVNDITVDVAAVDGDQFLMLTSQETGTLFIGDTLGVLGYAFGTFQVIGDDEGDSLDIEFTGTGGNPDVHKVYVQPAVQGNIGAGTATSATHHTTEINDGPSGAQLQPYLNHGTSWDEATNTSRMKLIRGRGGFPRFVFSGSHAGQAIRIQQEQSQWSITQVEAIRTYIGTSTQGPDPVLSELETAAVGGSGNVPGFRLKVVAFFENLELTDFGNRVPGFEAILRVDGSGDVSGIITEIMLVAGYNTSQFDVSGCTKAITGYAVRGAQNLRTQLQPILLATQTVARQEDGIIYFQDRASLPRVNITADITAGTIGDDRARPFTIKDAPNALKVARVSVKHKDPDQGFQTSTQESENFGIEGDISNVELGEVVITADQGQQLADTLWAQSRVSQHTISFQLPPTWLGRIHEGYVAQIDDTFGRDWEILVNRVEETTDGLLLCEGVEEDVTALTQTALSEGAIGLLGSTGQGGGGPPLQGGIRKNNQASRAVSSPGNIRWELLDLNPLQDSHVNMPGFYLAACSADQNRDWAGGVLYMSHQDVSGYTAIASVAEEAIMGTTSMAPVLDAHTYSIDRRSTIRVTLINKGATLESVTEDLLYRGSNRFLVGEEIIGVQTATLVSTSVEGMATYELTNLLRGLKDTWDQIELHSIRERVVWLDGPGIDFIPLNLTSADEVRYWKLAAYGQDLELVDVVESNGTGNDVFIPMTCRTCRPYKVNNVTGTRAADNAITLKWERQTRMTRSPVDQGEPLHERANKSSVEGYFVRALAGPGSSTVKTQWGPGYTRSITYTNSMQVGDSFTPGDPITFEIVHQTQYFHEGPAVEITIN